MMIKYKVSDVAKDFNVQSKEIIAVLAQHNLPGKKSATALEEHELDIVFEYFTQKHATENLDSNQILKRFELLHVLRRLPDFESGPFNHLGTSPY